jgi:hypothetical protein
MTNRERKEAATRRDEAITLAWIAYAQAIAPARKARDEATALAWKTYAQAVGKRPCTLTPEQKRAARGDTE